MTERQLTYDQAKAYVGDLLRQGRVDEARDIVNQLYVGLPNDPDVAVLAGRCELLMGRPSVARSLLAKAAAAAPDSEAVKAALAEYDALDRERDGHAYRNAYLYQRQRHMEFPMNIALETVGRCNATCNFCPHSELDRKTEVMSDALYEKIIDEAAAIPESSPLNFYMNVVNEPFMDKKIFPRMRLLNERIPRATIGIYTNMNVMPRDFFENLVTIRNLTYWNVSFNAANKAEYEATMVIDFDRTVGNIRRLLEENRQRKFLAGPIYLSRIGTRDAADVRFLSECKSLFADFEADKEFVPVCKNRADWLGQIEAIGKTQIPASMPCIQWFNISIFCNGVVPHCCMDAKGDFPFGDVNKQSLLEIYNNPQFRNLRQNVISRDVIYPCNTCALM